MPASYFVTHKAEFQDPRNPYFNVNQNTSIGGSGTSTRAATETKLAELKSDLYKPIWQPRVGYTTPEQSYAINTGQAKKLEETLRINDEFRSSPEGRVAIRLTEINQPFNLGNDFNDRTGVGYVTPQDLPAVENILKQIGTENDVTLSIAATLAKRYGVDDLKQVATKPGTNEWYNTKTNQTIPQQFATYDDGNATYFFGLNKNASGGLTFDQPRSPNPRAGGVLKDLAPLIGLAAFLIPGIGAEIGAAILGEATAATVAGVVGLSVPAVNAAVGAAALSAGTTALQGGSVEQVLQAGVSAAVASGLNVAAGGGVSGAVTGSIAGTVIQGGDINQVVTNALAAGVGAGVQGALPENPDAGKIIGSAARTYIATGGALDKTLLNTAATAVGTLDQPANTAQQTQAASTPAKVSQDLIPPFEEGGLRYEEQPDGTAKVTDQAGNERIISYGEFSKIVNADASSQSVVSPAPADATALATQTVSAPAPVVSPTVTGTDLINQVAAQTTPTVDPIALERVMVQGQGANVANVAPVSTEITSPRPDTTRGLAPVTVTATTEKAPEPGFEEYKPIPEPKVSDVVTDVSTTTPSTTPTTSLDRVTVTGARDLVDPFVDIAPPSEPYQSPESGGYGDAPEPSPPDTSLDPVTITGTRDLVDPFVDIAPPYTPTAPEVVSPVSPVSPEVKTDDPKVIVDTFKKPETIYPTVTGVPPVVPTRPSRQPIITGVSPARLLADALAAYRPAGAIEGEESGKERQNVWNEKSLRLKDALGL